MFDVLVLGAGPAGAAAAAFAAARSLRVAVFDENPAAGALPQIEWLAPAAAPLLDALRIDRAPLKLGEINAVTFLDAQRARTARARVQPGVDLVRIDRLRDALLAAAAARGAVRHDGCRIAAIRAAESEVCLTSETGAVHTGRFLVAADGPAAWSARQLAILPDALAGAAVDSRHWSCVHDATAPHRAEPEQGELVVWMLSDTLGAFATACRAGPVAAAALVAAAGEQADAARFEDVLEAFRSSGALPRHPGRAAGEAVRRRIPRGLALEMETHVAKRALVVGDAGGFVSALGADGLYPAIQSAALAVEACAAARDAENPQDALAAFDTGWRGALVETLRLPNADLRFLMPLVFSNARIAEKLARAVLWGADF